MILISLPAYNEEQSLEPLLNDIGNVMNELNIDYKILILDDGSTDNTLKILNSFSKKLPLIIKKHNVNQGLGKTLNDLFKESARITNDEDIIITFDADNTHKPKHIPLMLPHFKEGYNLVIASRFRKGSKEIGFPLHRILLSQISSLLLRVIFPIKGVKDYTCGYRAYKSSLLKKAVEKYNENLITFKGFPGVSEILIKLNELDLKAKEIPLILRYDFKKGKSKMKLLSTIKEYFKLIYYFKFKKNRLN